MNQLNTINGFSGIELEAMQKDSEYLRPYIEAKNEKKIIHQDKQEVLTKLYALIIRTIDLSGENKKYNLDNQQTKYVAGFVYDTLIEQYKGATISEVENAFNRGLNSEYGEFVGYGVITFGKFIKGYFTSPKREQAIKEWYRYQNMPQTTTKPVYKFFEKNMEIANYFFEICTEKTSERFDTIVNHEDNVMHLPSIYMFLYDNYQITFTDESKKIIRQKAYEKYKKYVEKSQIKKYDEKGFNAIVQSVVDGQNKTLEWYMKLEALIFLTLRLKERGKTYKDLKPNV